MKKIEISDVTLRELSENAEISFSEKVETVKLLLKIGVDCIETGKITNKKTDALFLHTIAPLAENATIVMPVGLSSEDLDGAWTALSLIKRKRLQISAPTSTVQMEFLCHLKPRAMQEAIQKQVSEAKALCADVEFVAEDATRSDIDFLTETVRLAIESGANIITFKDSAGELLPVETEKFIGEIAEKLPQISEVTFGFECMDSISMGVATALTAIKCGATLIKTSVSSSEVLPLKAFAKTLSAKGDDLGISVALNRTLLSHSVSKIEKLLTDKHAAGHPLAEIVNVVGEDFSLGVGDDINTVSKHVAMLGYELTEEDLKKVYERFSSLAEKKHIGARELEAIVASCALQVPPTYKLISYVINSGNLMTASANIVLEKNGENHGGISLGDGPIDAAFIAIEKIIGRHYELDDFQIQSVTEGREAVGESIVKLRAYGKLYSGRGISTDIIGASIRAYVNALNKICFDNGIG